MPRFCPSFQEHNTPTATPALHPTANQTDHEDSGDPNNSQPRRALIHAARQLSDELGDGQRPARQQMGWKLFLGHSEKPAGQQRATCCPVVVTLRVHTLEPWQHCVMPSAADWQSCTTLQHCASPVASTRQLCVGGVSRVVQQVPLQLICVVRQQRSCRSGGPAAQRCVCV